MSAPPPRPASLVTLPCCVTGLGDPGLTPLGGLATGCGPFSLLHCSRLCVLAHTHSAARVVLCIGLGLAPACTDVLPGWQQVAPEADQCHLGAEAAGRVCHDKAHMSSVDADRERAAGYLRGDALCGGAGAGGGAPTCSRRPSSSSCISYWMVHFEADPGDRPPLPSPPHPRLLLAKWRRCRHACTLSIALMHLLRSSSCSCRPWLCLDTRPHRIFEYARPVLVSNVQSSWQESSPLGSDM